MPALMERTVLPPSGALDELADALHQPSAPSSTTIIGPSGEQIVLPAEVFAALLGVVDAMQRGQAVTIAPVQQRLTTQEAADLLGISRPTLVRLLEDGEIPFELPGRHRRILLADVLAYRERRSIGRREALDEMVDVAQQAGMYEATATPKRTR
jgi:excisionase family DNA binding protein